MVFLLPDRISPAAVWARKKENCSHEWYEQFHFVTDILENRKGLLFIRKEEWSVRVISWFPYGYYNTFKTNYNTFIEKIIWWLIKLRLIKSWLIKSRCFIPILIVWCSTEDHIQRYIQHHIHQKQHFLS